MKQYIIITILLLGAFSAGRWLSPSIAKIDNKTVQVEAIKTVEDTHIITQTKKIEHHKKDGSFTVETIINESLAKDITTTKKDTVKNETITKYNQQTFSIDILAGLDITHPVNLVYGVHIANSLIGPIRLGAFGFTDGRLGVSLGLLF